jgi:hypothetical protein
MKRILLILVALLLSTAAASGDISKDDLKDLLRIGMSEGDIRTYVDAHRPVLPLSANDLTELRAAGASNELLQFLITPVETPEVPPVTDSYGGTVYPDPSSYSTPYYPYSPYYYYPSYPYYSFWYPTFVAPCYPTSYYHPYYYHPFVHPAPVPARSVAPYRSGHAPAPTPGPPPSTPAPPPSGMHGGGGMPSGHGHR